MIGGAAVTEEFVPGFKFSVFSYLMSLLHPRVIADLELAKYGYQVLPATDMFGPLPGKITSFSPTMSPKLRVFRPILGEGRGDLSRV